MAAPSDEGKQSVVAGVNDSPVDCQSRDRNRRSDFREAVRERKTYKLAQHIKFSAKFQCSFSPSGFATSLIRGRH